MDCIWQALTKEHFRNEREDLPEQCDICIIGGGLTGLYSAVLLAKKGFHVVLLEASEHIGEGATSLSTGKLTIQHGTILQKLAPEVRPLYVSANEQAISRFKNLLPPALFTKRTAYLYSQNAEQSNELKLEYDLYEQLQLQAFATNETELPFPVDLAIALKEQYEINPYNTQLALVKLAEKLGVTILTNCRVTHINHTENQIIAKEQPIHYKNLIVATHYPIDAIPALQIMKLTNSRSYICATPISETFDGYYLSVAEQGRTIRTATIDEQHYLLYGGTHHLAGSKANTNLYYKTLQQE
ncbi:MAG: FAD-dependent oxidoreductase, partial [Lysinibacillus sp.]